MNFSSLGKSSLPTMGRNCARKKYLLGFLFLPLGTGFFYLWWGTISSTYGKSHSPSKQTSKVQMIFRAWKWARRPWRKLTTAHSFQALIINFGQL